jgi:hypothetical protein
MGELIHVSRIRIEKDKGPVRRPTSRPFPSPCGTGSTAASRSSTGGTAGGTPTTLDHMIAAVAGE